MDLCMELRRKMRHFIVFNSIHMMCLWGHWICGVCEGDFGAASAPELGETGWATQPPMVTV